MPRDGHGTALAWGDFDGDGHLDLAVGSPDAGSNAQGRIEVFRGDGASLASAPAWAVVGEDLETRGGRLAVGDVNADGFDDLLIGSGGRCCGWGWAGCYLGSPTGLAPDAAWTVVDRGFEPSVPVAFVDVDRDGRDDACVAGGKLVDPVALTWAGVVDVSRGTSSGPSPTIDQRLVLREWAFPLDLWSVGDVDADGSSDLMALLYEQSSLTNFLMLLLNRPSGLEVAGWIHEVPFTSSLSAVGMGDVDGDGFGDVIVGEYSFDLASGRVHFYRGAPDGLASAPSWSSDLGITDGAVGHALAAGDLDGDGRTDLLAGVPWRLGASGEPVGAVVAAFGACHGLEQVARWEVQGSQPFAAYGRTVAVGALDGDPHADFVVANPNNPLAPFVGLVHAHRGRPRDGHAPCVDAPAQLTSSCSVIPLPTTVTDADGDALAYRWTSSCPDATFIPDDATLEAALVVESACSRTCTVSLTADDGRCGVDAASIEVVVDDDVAPVLADVPASGMHPCSTPVLPPVVTAFDACDPAPALSLSTRTLPGPCDAEYRLERHWTLTDACGNAVEAHQALDVVDDVPPVVRASDAVVACAWPPNGRTLTFGLAAFAAQVEDDCSAVSVELVACRAVDVTAEGEIEADDGSCAIAGGGQEVSVVVRRPGRARGGRRYLVEAMATDACGNVSAPTVVGVVWVPHDQREAPCGR